MDRISEKQSADGAFERAQADGERTRLARHTQLAVGMPRTTRRFLGVGLGLAMVFGIPGCHKSAQGAAAQSAIDQNGADPADANMASASGGSSAGQPAQVLGESAQGQDQQQGEDYSQQQAAPIVRQAPDSGQQSNDNGAANNGSGDNAQLSDQQATDLYADDLTDAQASQPPPPLPDYDQPPAPDPDYLWTPGYWDTTGFQAAGWTRRMRARCGPRATGDSMAGPIASTMVTGGCISASMAAWITVTAMSGMDTMAATGTADTSSTTRQSHGLT